MKVAFQRMYNALMAIGAIDGSHGEYRRCFNQAQVIANACITEMNVEHTKLIQEALGIGKSDV